MDSLFRQTRVRFPGFGQEKKEESGSSKERKMSPQKTVAFKETRREQKHRKDRRLREMENMSLFDGKKDQNWFRRQFSRQMSQNNDSNDIDRATAVAAAAYAISSLEDLGIPYQKEEPGTSKVTTGKSKNEEATIWIQEPSRASKRFSAQDTMKSSENPASMVPATAATDTKKPQKTLLPAPSFRKTASALDMVLSGGSKVGTASKPDVAAKPPNDKQLRRRFETETETETSISIPDLPTIEKSASLPPPPQPMRQSSAGPGMRKTQADAWEEAEMARVKERYEKHMATILDWEQKKKAKAKRQTEKSERKLEEKRAKALKKSHNEMQYIDQVAGGARAKAEKKKRDDELKVKEKANIIRRTGSLPKTCFCF